MIYLLLTLNIIKNSSFNLNLHYAVPVILDAKYSIHIYQNKLFTHELSTKQTTNYR